MRTFQLFFQPGFQISVPKDHVTTHDDGSYSVQIGDPKVVARGHMDAILHSYHHKVLPPDVMETMSEALVQGDLVLIQRLESIRRGGNSNLPNHTRPSAARYKDLGTSDLIEAAKVDIKECYRFFISHDDDFLKFMFSDGIVDVDAYLSYIFEKEKEGRAMAFETIATNLGHSGDYDEEVRVLDGKTVVLPHPNIQQKMKLKALKDRFYKLLYKIQDLNDPVGASPIFCDEYGIEFTGINRECWELNCLHGILIEIFRRIEAWKILGV